MNEALHENVVAACVEMEKTLKSRMYSRFLELEVKFYNDIVKIEETKAHYEYCFNELDRIGKLYGDVLQLSMARLQKKSYIADDEEEENVNIMYLLPNLDNDLAHIEFLSQLLAPHNPAGKVKITIAGYRKRPGAIQSRYISRLANDGILTVALFEDSHSGRLSLLEFFLRNKYSQLIIYSIPFQLSAWCRVLGKNRVVWASTKFHLNCFDELYNRIAWGLGGIEEEPSNGSVWKLSAAAPPTESIMDFSPDLRPRTRLVTVNREEKIATPVFLNAVAEILKARPSTTFGWTGRRETSMVTDFFRDKGLSSRVKFLGWVDPRAALPHFDIFLDTPHLSGLVAAKAFLAGMPTVSLSGATGQLSSLAQHLGYGRSAAKESLLAQGMDDYIETVINLIDSEENYNSRVLTQKALATKYGVTSNDLYNDHIRILMEFVNNKACGTGDKLTGENDLP
jgi:hypothetical protein